MLKVPRVRFLITQNPNEVLDHDHKTRLPGTVEWNLVRLAYEEFTKEHNPIVFENFKCPEGVEPLLFSQMCIYYYADKVPAVVNDNQSEDGLAYTEAITKNKHGKIIFKKHQNIKTDEDEPVGTVIIGTDHQPICVPGNFTSYILGKTSKINSNRSYMVETAAHANWPSGIVVNCSYDILQTSRTSMIEVNNTSRNIWIRQPFPTADIYKVELHPWQYCANLNREGNDIKISFQLAIPPEIEHDLQSNQMEAVEKSVTSEVQGNLNQHLGLILIWVQIIILKMSCSDCHLGLTYGIPLSKEQQDWLLDLIYDYKDIFSMHNEYLGFWNKLAHTIVTTTDKPVYLHHRTIPKQLQGKVRKCFNTWLRQGIMLPSESLHASQVVIVRKKTGEIWMCVDYCKLYSIVARDAFPLQWINEALQAENDCQWFTFLCGPRLFTNASGRVRY